MKRFQHISVADTKKRLASEEVALVDIRDPMSHQSGRIEGSLLLDNHNINQFIDTTPKNRPVIVYCYHGNSSQGAAQYLAEQGFEEVYSMDGGFAAWLAEL